MFYYGEDAVSHVMTSGQKIAAWLEAHIAENNGAWSSEQLAAEIDETIAIEKMEATTTNSMVDRLRRALESIRTSKHSMAIEIEHICEAALQSDRLKALDELTSESQRLGLYDSTKT